MKEFPKIIQGGMGVALSDYKLAKTVSLQGELGVVSGTGIDSIMALRLQKGDIDNNIRRALSKFPVKKIADDIVSKYYLKDGVGYAENFKMEMPSDKMSKEKEDIIVASNFAEIYLAKEGHSGVVGINLLEKIQTPNLASIYGAMLAGADYVIMGAGIPRDYPMIIDKLSRHEKVSIRLNIEGSNSGDDFRLEFDPTRYGLQHIQLTKPRFLAIVSSNILALTLMKKSAIKPDGLIVELPIAGGHNAPPRGSKELNGKGEPVYTDKDVVDINAIAKLGIPFYLAGGFSTKEKFKEAINLGATGVQIGTAFALSNESALLGKYRDAIIKGDVKVITDAKASPTGFPFKVALIEGTIAIDEVYQKRKRLCNLGYLREAYKVGDNEVRFLCKAGSLGALKSVGLKEEEGVGRKCLCNALFSTVGYPLKMGDGNYEPAIVTLGDELDFLKPMGSKNYSVKDYLDYIRG